MQHLLRAISTEMLKTKRTLAFWLTLIAPLTIAALQFFFYLQRSEYLIQEDANAWLSLAQGILLIWSLLMLPLFITLETALLSGLEHNANGWKHLFALPVARWAIYFAKQIIGLGLIGLSFIVLLGLIILAGFILRFARPVLGLDAPVPWHELLTVILLTYIASWLILAFHTWVSTRWPSFVVAVTVGICATVAAAFLINWEWSKLYPWTLPGFIATGLGTGERAIGRAVVGCIGGIAMAIICCWDFVRRDVA